MAGRLVVGILSSDRHGPHPANGCGPLVRYAATAFLPLRAGFTGAGSSAGAGRSGTRRCRRPSSRGVSRRPRSPTRRTPGDRRPRPASPWRGTRRGLPGLAEDRHVDEADLTAAAHPVDRQSQLADLHLIRDLTELRVLRQTARADDLVDVHGFSPSVGWLLVTQPKNDADRRAEPKRRRGTPAAGLKRQAGGGETGARHVGGHQTDETQAFGD